MYIIFLINKLNSDVYLDNVCEVNLFKKKNADEDSSIIEFKLIPSSIITLQNSTENKLPT